MRLTALAIAATLAAGWGRGEGAETMLDPPLPEPQQSLLPMLQNPTDPDPVTRSSMPVGPPSPKPSPHEIRIATATLIVRTFYNHAGRANFLPYVGKLIAEHEWYEQEGHRKGYDYAEGFAEAYWYSLVYGGANFSLRCYASAPGLCSGPMDVKSTSLAMHHRMLSDPAANIHHHVAEMWIGQSKGYRDLGLCEYVMLPAAPRDWGGGRFRRTDARHRAVIARAYREGRLP